MDMRFLNRSRVTHRLGIRGGLSIFLERTLQKHRIFLTFRRVSFPVPGSRITTATLISDPVGEDKRLTWEVAGRAIAPIVSLVTPRAGPGPSARLVLFALYAVSYTLGTGLLVDTHIRVGGIGVPKKESAQQGHGHGEFGGTADGMLLLGLGGYS